MQGDIDELKTALQGEDDTVIKTAFDKLNESQSKLGEAIYAASQEAADGPSPEGDADASDDDEDIVDAELVDDDEDDAKKK